MTEQIRCADCGSEFASADEFYGHKNEHGACLPAEVVSRRPYELIDHARALEQRIERKASAIRESWYSLAADLYEFHEGSMWTPLGYDTFEEWLAGPEIDLGRRHVYRLLQVYRDLVIDRHVPPEALTAEVTKIDAVIPAIKKGRVGVEDALTDAETLSRSDLKEKYGGKREPNAELDAEKEPDIIPCPICGSRVEQERIRADWRREVRHAW